MIFYSTDPDVALPKVDIYNYLDSNPCQVPPGKTVFVDPLTDRSLTFSDFQIQTKQFAAGLQDRFNFQPGQVVAILSFNQYDFGVPIFGTLCAGGVVTTINHSYTVDEVVHQLKDSGARLIITAAELLPTAVKAGEICGIQTDSILIFDQTAANGFQPYRTLFAKRLATPVKRSLEDIAYLCYSSGTTGKSKGVMLSHGNITANMSQIMSYDAPIIAQKDLIVLGFLPLYHIYGLVNCLHISLFTGTKTIIMPKFELPSFLGNIQKYKVTNTFIVPPVALALAKHPIVNDYDLSSLRHIACGAAPLPKDLLDMIEKRLGIYCRQGFGMTEASPLVACIRPGQRKDGSVGPLVCNLMAKVVDANGKGKCAGLDQLGVGEEGEWLLKGPNVMKGYINNDEATKNTITPDGWMHTGDIVYVDKDGNWFVVDRLKELIKMKGFQVAPAELEALLQTHPHVLDCAVIPAYDASQATEIPRAYVVPKPTVAASELEALKKDIIKFVEDRVANHKRLRGGVKFINEIPKSASGKILRKDIVKLDRAEDSQGKAKL
ncbi:hypothetical protein DFQ27_002388 [Actinomortierella ambigua]|uniref:Acetyl-CoA synthetase-like protein n=1 Tax=Actinomortierella ambigua TaxID=1343610 RepID=A0A9P6QLJ3_9FUNG|nr:hypothetical protein DFQ27_002388 [Actinomortierella ambigua]